MRTTSDGYLVGEVRCARVGIQSYHRSEIGLAGDGLVNVYRPESSVFSKDSMATFPGKPVTLNHPPVQVTADNWKTYAVGDIGEDVARDGDFIRVPIKLMDSEVISAVKAGTREISMGYTCSLIHQDGVSPDGIPYQAIQSGPIRINHLAVVKSARGGSELRIGDGAEIWGISPVQDDNPGNTPNNPRRSPEMELKTVVLGDAAVQVAVSDLAAIEAYKQSMTKKLADAEAAKKKSDDEKDEEIGSLKVKLKKAEDAAVIDVDALVAQRSALVTQVKALDADIDVTGKTDADLRKAAVVSKLGDAAVAGLGDAEINGMFKALALSAPAARNPVADAIKNGVTNIGDSQAQMQDSWKQSVADLNSWRNEGGAK